MIDLIPTYKHLQIELDNYCNDVKRIYANKLASGNKIASGQLVNNFTVRAVFINQDVLVKINTVDYFKYVEEGRPAGKFPPLVKIEQWIEQKGIIPRPDKNGKLPTPKQLSFLIGRKISEEGIEPTHYLASTQEDLNKQYKNRFKKALQLDIYDMGKRTAAIIHKIINV